MCSFLGAFLLLFVYSCCVLVVFLVCFHVFVLCVWRVHVAFALWFCCGVVVLLRFLVCS